MTSKASGSSPSLWERDSAEIRKACLAGLKTGQNQFELVIVPTSGLTEKNLPEGFSEAVRKFCGLKESAKIIPQKLHLLPFYRPADRKRKVASRIPQFHGIVGSAHLEVVRTFCVKNQGDATSEVFAVGLQTLSRRNDGELFPGEVEYLQFMRMAGTLLRHHKIISSGNPEHAWIEFLVAYVWNHDRPAVSHLVATVGNLWQRSLAAIDRSMNGEPQQSKRSRGRPKQLGPRDEEIYDRWISEHQLSKISRKDFALTVGISYDALCRLLNSVKQRRRRNA